MKNCIITMMLIVTNLLAQNYEPGHRKFKWGAGDSTYISADSLYFRQDKPILGWHWGGSYKISKSLLVNQIDHFRHWENWGFTFNDLDSGYRIFLKPEEYFLIHNCR